MKNFIHTSLLVIASIVISITILINYSSASYAIAKKEAPAKPLLIDSGKVKDVIKSDLIVLENDKKYRLENIRVPLQYDQEAVDLLSENIKGKNVLVYTHGKGGKVIKDRYGIPITQVIKEEESLWLQKLLISKGLSWAYSTRENNNLMPSLLGFEQTARDNNFGLWSNSKYNLKTDINVKDHLNSYQVVEGTIIDTLVKKDSAYLNFGDDWRTDFTIKFDIEYWPEFKEKIKNFTIDRLKNKKVRIRGWVQDKNGPLIHLDHFNQIEIFKEKSKTRTKGKERKDIL